MFVEISLDSVVILICPASLRGSKKCPGVIDTEGCDFVIVMFSIPSNSSKAPFTKKD